MLNYKIEDDYGVTEARADFRAQAAGNPRRRRPPAASRPRVRSIGAPDMPLVLPQARTRNGVGQTLRDLSEHPWAGADVTLTLQRRRRGRQ